MAQQTVVERAHRPVRMLTAEIPNEVAHLAVADVVGRELSGGEKGAAPFPGCLALFLEPALDHELQGRVLGEILSVDLRIENGVQDHAQLHLELLEAEPVWIGLTRVAEL